MKEDLIINEICINSTITKFFKENKSSFRCENEFILSLFGNSNDKTTSDNIDESVLF